MTFLCFLAALVIISTVTAPRGGVMVRRGFGRPNRIDIDKIEVTPEGHLRLRTKRSPQG
jgi:hypothetical protein